MYFVTKANIIASHVFWENLSADSQKKFCRFLSNLYNLKITRLLIPSFCKRYHISHDKLEIYSPASNQNKFQSFQDFFTRKLKYQLQINSEFAYPCEGYVCDSGNFANLKEVNVKGNLIHPKKIFGRFENEINNQDSFLNIFLHNHNYHRFHSPINGIVIDIEHIPGKLLFLRPWFYARSMVSLPAFLNERVIIKLQDHNQKNWLVSFVAGMGVGNIQLNEKIQIGNHLNAGDEMGLFLLGSTCCMSVPYQLQPYKYMEQVSVGAEITYKNN